jgi:hypothetical protein
MDLDKTLNLARVAFRKKNLNELTVHTDALIFSGIPEHVGSGYFLRGAYHELFDGNENHLAEALLNYSHAGEANPSAESYIAMATILVKMGPSHYESALVCLRNAADIKITPEGHLGFATIYSKVVPPEYELSKSYFLKAARFGRVQGLYGYANASRKLGQNFRALIVDIYRIISSPFIYLIIGKKILKGFWI